MTKEELLKIIDDNNEKDTNSLWKSWKYKNFFPDNLDVKIEVIVANEIKNNLNKPYVKRLRQAEVTQHIISSAFYRGCDWMKYKIKNEE